MNRFPNNVFVVGDRVAVPAGPRKGSLSTRRLVYEEAVITGRRYGWDFEVEVGGRRRLVTWREFMPLDYVGRRLGR